MDLGTRLCEHLLRDHEAVVLARHLPPLYDGVQKAVRRQEDQHAAGRDFQQCLESAADAVHEP